MSCLLPGVLTQPFVDLVSDVVRVKTGDIQIEVVSAPFFKLGVLASSVEVQIDAEEVAAVFDCGIFELESGLDLAVVLVVVPVVCND